jgi:preprotein translocase subunit SecG
MNIVNIIEIIWCVSAFGLTAMVLLHSPKGDGIGGIGGQAQLFSSTKSAESNLNRTLTIILSAGWLSSTPIPVSVPTPSVGN